MAAAEELSRSGYVGRRRAVRASTTPLREITRESLEVGRACYPVREWEALRATMGPCRLELREHGWCPHVGCQHHLYLDVSPRTGSIKLNFPDLEPWELSESCALEVAERGGATLEEVGDLMNITRERVRQLEARALRRSLMLAPAELRGELREAEALRAARQAVAPSAVGQGDLKAIRSALRVVAPAATQRPKRRHACHQLRDEDRPGYRPPSLLLPAERLQEALKPATPQRPAQPVQRPLGAEAAQGGALPARQAERPRRRRRPRWTGTQRRRVLEWLHVCQDPQLAGEIAELADVPERAVRPMLRALEAEGLARVAGRDSRRELWELAS